jgi:membrane associated rhomboid family serine protease
MSLASDIKYKMKRLNIAEKFIALNVVLFVLPLVLRSFLYLFKLDTISLMPWVRMSSSLETFITTPWTLISYGFFHVDFWHLFWNMAVLYFASRIFLNLFDQRRFLTVYFLGIIVGGLIFLLSYNIFPVFDNYPYLIGASAGVTAVLIFVCTYTPNTEVRLIFVNVRLWHIGAFFVLKDLISIPVSGNEGGNLAHLGGAAIGFFLAKKLLEGKEAGEWFSKTIDWVEGLFKPGSKSPLKTVHKNKGNTKFSAASSKGKATNSNQQQIDSILDKISKSGYESLTKQEKDFLFQSGKDN